MSARFDPESMEYLTDRCSHALNIKGEHFWCEVDQPHPGLAHSNADAQAIWGDSTQDTR